MLYDEIEEVIDNVVDGYISDSEISKFNEILNEKIENDPDYDENNFIDDFYDICSDIGFDYDDYIREQLDDAVMEYYDCLNFIENNNWYSGWKEIAYDENGGEPFDSISQLVYCILLNNFYQDNGVDLLAEKVYDLITS